jgi:hypothetical protein
LQKNKIAGNLLPENMWGMLLPLANSGADSSNEDMTLGH